MSGRRELGKPIQREKVHSLQSSSKWYRYSRRRLHFIRRAPGSRWSGGEVPEVCHLQRHPHRNGFRCGWSCHRRRDSSSDIQEPSTESSQEGTGQPSRRHPEQYCSFLHTNVKNLIAFPIFAGANLFFFIPSCFVRCEQVRVFLPYRIQEIRLLER